MYHGMWKHKSMFIYEIKKPRELLMLIEVICKDTEA